MVSTDQSASVVWITSRSSTPSRRDRSHRSSSTRHCVARRVGSGVTPSVPGCLRSPGDARPARPRLPRSLQAKRPRSANTRRLRSQHRVVERERADGAIGAGQRAARDRRARGDRAPASARGRPRPRARARGSPPGCAPDARAPCRRSTDRSRRRRSGARGQVGLLDEARDRRTTGCARARERAGSRRRCRDGWARCRAARAARRRRRRARRSAPRARRRARRGCGGPAGKTPITPSTPRPSASAAAQAIAAAVLRATGSSRSRVPGCARAPSAWPRRAPQPTPRWFASPARGAAGARACRRAGALADQRHERLRHGRAGSPARSECPPRPRARRAGSRARSLSAHSGVAEAQRASSRPGSQMLRMSTITGLAQALLQERACRACGTGSTRWRRPARRSPCAVS